MIETLQKHSKHLRYFDVLPCNPATLEMLRLTDTPSFIYFYFIRRALNSLSLNVLLCLRCVFFKRKRFKKHKTRFPFAYIYSLRIDVKLLKEKRLLLLFFHYINKV